MPPLLWKIIYTYKLIHFFQGKYHLADMHHSVDCRNSQFPRDSSLIFMCWLWYGPHYCFSLLGHMHMKSEHWFPSQHPTLVLPVTWLEAHIFYPFIKHIQLHWSTTSAFGDQSFFFYWWKLKYFFAYTSHYAYLITVVQLVCISWDIWRVSCKILFFASQFPRYELLLLLILCMFTEIYVDLKSFSPYK